MAHFDLENYETVQQRLDAFWSMHKDGRVITEILPSEPGRYIVRAAIYRDADSDAVSTGLAEEVIGMGMVNKTSALENCETSAIGRALRNAGIGKQASREEMEKVERHKTAPARTAEQIAADVNAVIIKAGEATSIADLRTLWAALPPDVLAATVDGETTTANYLTELAKFLQTDTKKG